jgi:hypothetical protein
MNTLIVCRSAVQKRILHYHFTKALAHFSTIEKCAKALGNWGKSPGGVVSESLVI